MRIAVDAMGGDRGPGVIIAGAIAAARQYDVAIALVGRRDVIQPAIDAAQIDGLDISIVDASDVIEMGEHPAMAVRKKPHSSIAVAIREVKDGRASAIVSAGNSGAVLASALVTLGRVRGVERPALGSLVPSLKEPTVIVDLGAVTDPKPIYLLQYARMARIYAQRMMGRPNPTLALLSNGEEPTKGNQLVQEVHALLLADPTLNFVGNIEGKEMLSGKVDIIIADGFTGNIALKTMEGTVSSLTALIRERMTATVSRKLAALVLKPAFEEVRARLDYAEIGGAPLLGINGVVVVAHGRSNERAIRSAIGAARNAVEAGLVGAIRTMMASEAHDSPADEGPV